MQPQGIDLSGLRDIHLPIIPPLWPLPDIFWVALFMFFGCILLFRWIWIKKHKLTAKKYANHEVESITNQFSGNNYQIAAELSLLMRRIALMKYPRQDVAVLTGKTWRHFLEKTTKKPVFKGTAGDIIENVMFVPPEQFKYKNITPLVLATKEWISENT